MTEIVLMRFEYDIRDDEKLINLVYKGKVSIPEIYQVIVALYEDPQYSAQYNGIVDIRDVAYKIPRPDDIRKMHDFVRIHPKRTEGRWAVLVSDPIPTACVMFYIQFFENPNHMSVFGDEFAARAWLSESEKMLS